MLLPQLILLSFGIIEFSLLMLEQGRATEATRRGARQAVMVDAVAVLDALKPGKPVNCTSAAGAVSCGTATVNSTAAFDNIVANMQVILPDIDPKHVQVQYLESGLGTTKSGGIKPFVTVSLVDYLYQFMSLGALPGLPKEVTLPSYASTEVPGGFAPP